MWSGAGYRVRSSKGGGRTCLGAHTWKLFKIDHEDFLASEVCVKCHRTRHRGLKPDDASKLIAIAAIDSANARKSSLKRELRYRVAERAPESRERVRSLLKKIGKLNKEIRIAKQMTEPSQIVGQLITLLIMLLLFFWVFK